MTLYAGTSGFSYEQWRGPFYPPEVRGPGMLAYYATRLPSVEINNTFYRMPKKSVVAGWRDRVPEHFRFAIKAPRRISHIKRLTDCAEEMRYLLEATAELGDKLGAVLVQLPPNFRADLDTLRRFLDLAPAETPLALEFRHASWLEDEAVLAALGARDRPIVIVDESGAPPMDRPAEGSWCYLRLRAAGYAPDALTAWAAYCASFDRSFAFFKHEDDGVGTALAERLLELASGA
jgi:uncharacterized protein YecE (DUF72 family)